MSDALNQAAVPAVHDNSVRWLLEHLHRTHSPPPVAFTAACIWSVINTFVNFQDHAFLQSCAQFPFPHLKGLLTKHAPHPMSFSSPIAFAPHCLSLLPSVELRDRPYSVGCKLPLNADKLVPHGGMPHRQGPHRSIDDQAATHHRRGRQSHKIQRQW